MSREPQTLVWLPTLHRLIATETVRHEARCDTCKAYPVIGMRYRCLRCFNYDLCQTCFFTGDHAKKHDGSHPIEEYCKQVTPFEDFKAFLEFVKLKVGKRELRRKERYLTIERSKSL
jgi:dystrophin